MFRMITVRIEAFVADRGYDVDSIREQIEAVGAEMIVLAKIRRSNTVRMTAPDTNCAI